MSRIFFHTPEPASSAGRYVTEIALALADAAIPVHVIGPANHQGRELFDRHPLITMHQSGVRSTSTTEGLLVKIWTNARFLIMSAIVLLRTVRQGDVVHFQFVLHFPFGALFFLLALLRGCKIVFTVHDPLPHKWLLPGPLRRLELWARAWSYRVSDALLVHSDAGRRTLTQRFLNLENKISLVVHGPYGLGGPALSAPQSSCLEVLLFGAIRENKGAHLAIPAIQQLSQEGLPIRLTIAGTVANRNEQEYWARCRELIAQFPAPIRCIDQFIPDEDLPQLFSECHCFLLPYTSFSSDSGVAVIALANGRPILATKAGGLGAVLEASNCGLDIAEPRIAAVVQTLRLALDIGPEHLEQLGRAGQAWLSSECSWKKAAAQTREVYESLIGPLQQERGDEYHPQPIFN